MIIGYARVSTREQHLGQQIDALNEYGCEKVYTEKVSGQSSKRPVLESVIEALRDNEDTLVFWRLDRVGRDHIHLEQTIKALDERGITLVSLKENLDTKTASGKLMYRIMGVMATFELDLICERTEAGMNRARSEGKRIGRTYSESPILMWRCIQYKMAGYTPAKIQKKFPKAPSDQTIYRWTKKWKERDPDICAHLAKVEKTEIPELTETKGEQ